ncbi:MAG TPA: hypothetical protein VD999_02820 [Vitreimonas sp.]|nr:hypothetical protein [Vitreimonas sp.]
MLENTADDHNRLAENPFKKSFLRRRNTTETGVSAHSSAPEAKVAPRRQAPTEQLKAAAAELSPEQLQEAVKRQELRVRMLQAALAGAQEELTMLQDIKAERQTRTQEMDTTTLIESISNQLAGIEIQIREAFNFESVEKAALAVGEQKGALANVHLQLEKLTLAAIGSLSETVKQLELKKHELARLIEHIVIILEQIYKRTDGIKPEPRETVWLTAHQSYRAIMTEAVAQQHEAFFQDVLTNGKESRTAVKPPSLPTLINKFGLEAFGLSNWGNKTVLMRSHFQEIFAPPIPVAVS